MSLAEAVKRARRVYLCGNGGSAANAIHLANDFVSCGVRAFSLTADVSTLTAIANDYDYDRVFSLQLLTFGEPGDLLIALSGSGKSRNILKALEMAKRIGMTTCALFGDFEEHAEEVDLLIKRGENMQAAEEAQLILGHEAMRELRARK